MDKFSDVLQALDDAQLPADQDQEIRFGLKKVKSHIDQIDNQVAFSRNEMGDLSDSVWAVVKGLLEGKKWVDWGFLKSMDWMGRI